MTHPAKDYTAAERARWLAELSKALDEAHKLAATLGLHHSEGPEAAEFCARLAAARAQVKGLRLGRGEDASGDQSPKWTNHAIWPKNTDCDLV